MSTPRAAAHRLAGILLAALCVCRPAQAAGPLLVNGAGQALKWQQTPIPFNPDRGNLGQLSNASAVSNVTADFAVWSAVATSSIRFANAGLLPEDVTAQNYGTYVGTCNDGLNPIVFDTDGTITDDLLGPGSNREVLGFASPDCGTFVPPVITEGSAVLNGKFIDGIDSASNPEISVSDFDTVFTHEFGHYVNLDHSQIGLEEALDNDPSNDGVIATMFPFIENPALQSQPKLDDTVSISTLYPAASFASAYGTISGSVLLPDGTTPFQGAYVIARKTDNPRSTAVGVASGYLFFPAFAGGPPAAALEGFYQIPGLPPGNYTVEVRAIDPIFTDGSSVGPLDPPAELPGPPEFWNGSQEAGGNPPDDPTASEPIKVTAGSTVASINVVLNGTTCATFAQIFDGKIAIAKLNTPPGDDTLSLTGALSLQFPFNPALDPSANGMRVVIRSQAASIVDLQIPTGSFDSLVGTGWKVNRNATKWTYYDRTAAPPDGIVKVVVQDQRAQVPGRVKFTVTGKAGTYAVPAADLPLTAQVYLNEHIGTSTQCGQASFPGPAPAPKCAYNRLGSKVTCK